jgi:hypothetical protein
MKPLTATLTIFHATVVLCRYPTPAWAVEELQERLAMSGTVLDCCGSNQDAIKCVLAQHGCTVYTNDLKDNACADHHVDATDPLQFAELARVVGPDWIVTSPPYSHAVPIVKHALQAAAHGVALKVRLSFLEPCRDRVGLLQQHPPTAVMYLPRINYRRVIRDRMSEAWLIWVKNPAKHGSCLSPHTFLTQPSHKVEVDGAPEGDGHQ